MHNYSLKIEDLIIIDYSNGENAMSTEETLDYAEWRRGKSEKEELVEIYKAWLI